MGQDEQFLETPLTDLQIALSKAVDLARALPDGSVSVEYHSLARVYVEQIMGGVFHALERRGEAANRQAQAPLPASVSATPEGSQRELNERRGADPR